MTDRDGSALLELARAAIRTELLDDGSLKQALDRTELTEALHQPRGVFVTLRERSDRALRGCIGRVEATAALYRAVIDVAPQAAMGDPRFAPLGAAELEQVELSLSALSPFRALATPDDLRIGEHGVELQLEAHRAVFLPQVAVEQRWDRRQLLEQLARKAGLRPEDWKRARLAVFTTECFTEA